MRKIKVLLASHIGFPVGGISILNENLLASDLTKIVDLKFVETSNGNLSFDKRGNFHVKNIINASENIKNFIISVFKIKPHLIHIGTAYGSSLWKHSIMGLLSKIFGYKFILQFHFNCEKFPSPNSLTNKILMKIIGLSSGFIVLSNDWLLLEQLYPGKLIRVIPNAINTKLYQVKKFNKETNVKVLYLGHIGEDKGVFDLFDAIVSIIHDYDINVELDFYGDPLFEDDDQKLQTLIDSNVVSSKIKLHKPIYGEEKIRVLSESDLLVLPSPHEGMPISIIEAMASGLPVIATNVGGVPDQVIDGKTGFLYHPGNQKELKEALMKLINDSKLRCEMGNEGRERALQVFDIKSKVSMILGFYEEIFNKSN